ncbi:MAG TPA: hypothetical protein VHB48_19790 [Chitinophagaceae bacterium]|nr:hypothetical protein [Chitinophagaceae bacterium]
MQQLEFKNSLAAYVPRCILAVLVIFNTIVNAQAQTQERLRVYNAFDVDKIYSDETVMHTVWKPLIYADSLLPDTKNYPWAKRKFFLEHLMQVQQKGFNIYGDVIVDERIGKSRRYDKMIGSKEINVKTPGVDTRGYEVSGSIGNKIYFETNFYENQGKFGGYVDSFIRASGVIPGQANYKNNGDGGGFDFSYSSARLTYIPSNHLLFDLGYGKNFIGDGYRSLLLSDWSISYPYFRTAITFNKFQYSVMWSQYVTVDRTQNNKLGYFRKWSQTYLLDWKVNPALTLSLFESVIWPDQTHTAYRGKDVSPWLASPVIFLHGSQSPSGVANNDIVGLNAKVKFYDRSYFYGQLVVNQLGKFTSFKNRTGFQIGMRSSDVFEIPGFNILTEFNAVRPYTYAGSSPDVNYSNGNQPLADPLGANFREGLVVATYTHGNWWFRIEGFLANYGADSGGVNYGHNIFTILPGQAPVTGSITTGQGVSTKMQFADFKVAYILNHQSNLRFETGATYRREFSSLFDYKDLMFYVGIRMSFRSIMYDF